LTLKRSQPRRPGKGSRSETSCRGRRDKARLKWLSSAATLLAEMILMKFLCLRTAQREEKVRASAPQQLKTDLPKPRHKIFPGPTNRKIQSMKMLQMKKQMKMSGQIRKESSRRRRRSGDRTLEQALPRQIKVERLVILQPGVIMKELVKEHQREACQLSEERSAPNNRPRTTSTTSLYRIRSCRRPSRRCTPSTLIPKRSLLSATASL